MTSNHRSILSWSRDLTDMFQKATWPLMSASLMSMTSLWPRVHPWNIPLMWPQRWSICDHCFVTMFQLSQESSVIYQEAIPVHFDDEYSFGGFGGLSSRRKVYRYCRTRTTTTATSRSNENISRVYISKHTRNGYNGVPARKMMALREFSSSSQNDYRLQVSCTSRLVGCNACVTC